MTRRWIISMLAVLGICMSMTTASATRMPAKEMPASACCHSDGHDQRSNDEPADPCAGAGCIAACCRVISAVDGISHDLLDEAPAVAHAMTWSLVALGLTDPDSIFHPPRA